jgi:arginyl-tRNA synthetase
VNLRTALRGAFAAALGRLSADGVTAIAADEIAGLVEQVRETADAKFGDYSGTMAMALAKKAGKKPRDVAVEIIRRLEAAPGYADLFEPPGDPVGPGFINVRVKDEALAAAVARAVADDRLGQRVVAAVVAAAASPPTTGELRDFVAASLDRTAAPREVVFVAELPRRGIGKIDRRALRDHYRAAEQYPAP